MKNRETMIAYGKINKYDLLNEPVNERLYGNNAATTKEDVQSLFEAIYDLYEKEEPIKQEETLKVEYQFCDRKPITITIKPLK